MNARLNDLKLIESVRDAEMLEAMQVRQADQIAADAEKIVLACQAGDRGAAFEPMALATLLALQAQASPPGCGCAAACSWPA